MKSIKKRDLDKKFRFSDSFKKCKIEMIFLAIVSVVALGYSIGNAVEIQKASEQSAKKFFSEITYQKAKRITNELNHKASKLKDIADALGIHAATDSREKNSKLLKKKASLSEFDFIVVYDTKMNCIADFGGISGLEQEIKKLSKIKGIEKALNGEYAVDCLKKKVLVYTAPVYVDEEISYVVCGLSTEKSIMAAFETEKSLKQSIACIVSSNADEIVTLENPNHLKNCHDLFQEEGKQQVSRMIRQAKVQEGKRESAIYITKNKEKKELFISCNSLGINDWFLMSVIPTKLFTGISKGYILKMNLIIMVISLLFFAFFIIMYRTYEAGSKELTEKVFFDEITKGSNGKLFRMRYRQMMSEIKPYTYTIVLLDIKNFKLFTEKFGEQKGNELLKYSYNIIMRNMNEENNEFAARIELDHFFICMKESKKEWVQSRIDTIIGDINAEWKGMTGRDYPIQFWQSAYIVDDNKLDIQIVKDRVRVALQKQHAEASEKCVFYDQEVMDTIKRNYKLESLFDYSIENHNFEMYLQPKVEMGTWKLKGAEALVRWKHPKEGIIFPSEFIPLFEKNGKIQELDLYMFTEACKFLAERQQSGKPLFIISVNLSRNHFRTPGFIEKFVEISDKYNVPRNLLEFELTERIFMNKYGMQKIREGMHQIHEMGYLCSIDDFGSGYSSLALVREFEIDTLKLDRSFFTDMGDKKSRNIIKCLTELAKNLDVQTVAEGIETEEQVRVLKALSCNLIQGYIFSKPLPVEEFKKWESGFAQSVKEWLESHL